MLTNSIKGFPDSVGSVVVRYAGWSQHVISRGLNNANCITDPESLAETKLMSYSQKPQFSHTLDTFKVKVPNHSISCDSKTLLRSGRRDLPPKIAFSIATVNMTTLFDVIRY